MKIHGILDRASLYMGAPFLPRNFCDGTESASFTDHLAGVSLSLPRLDHEAWHEIPASTLIGTLGARLQVARRVGDEAPTLVFHHGANELPPDATFRRMLFQSKPPLSANLIFVQAPFHGSIKRYANALRSLSAWMAMLAVSVRLIEAVVHETRNGTRERGKGPILVSGISLGGYVTNRHLLHFDTADAYAPLLAGAAMGDMLFETPFRHTLSTRALHDEERIRALLNCDEELAKKKSNKVFPLLARHDEFIRYEREKVAYGDQPIELIDKGHVTGALAHVALRGHLERVLARIAAARS